MEYLIEVESAAAEPAVLRFKLGREVGPFHVGGKGKWRVSASGVADKHAYLYFDGAQLFLQSVSAETPVLADGRPLPCEWVPIAAPCEIALGDARLRYDALEEIEVENPDTADQPLVPPPAPSAPGAPGGRPKLDSDATRLVPIEELHAKRRAITGSTLTPVSGIPTLFNGPSSIAPPGGAPMGASPFGSVPPPNGPGSVNPAMDQAQIPPHAFITTHPSMRMGLGGTMPIEPEQAKPKPKSAWSEMSFPRKAIAILFLPMVASVAVLFFPEVVGPLVAPLGISLSPAAPTSSQRARAPAASGAPSTSAATTQPTESATAPTATAITKPTASGTPTATASAPVRPPPMTKADAAQAAAEAQAAKDRTLQRQAADAIASGAFDRAASIYEELAKKYPDDPAYPAAAAIARAKAAGN